MEEIINNNSKRKKIIKNSEKIVEKFSWEKSSEKFFEIIKSSII